MAYLKAERPLSGSAARKADDDFYASHPEMVANGHRQPLDPCDDRQQQMRIEWLNRYAAHGGKVHRATKDTVCRDWPPPNKVDPVVTCHGGGCFPTPTPTLRNDPPPGNSMCQLLQLDLTCEHGRKAGQEGILIVVPSSEAALGDKITGTLQMKGHCGKHPTWSVGGYWSTQGSDASFNFNTTTWKSSLGGLLGLQKAKPHTYRVQANMCSGGGPSVYDVRAYPPGKVTLKFNAKKYVELFKRGLKFLPLDHEEVEKWKFLEGNVSYEGSWNEDKNSWRGYYEKSVSGGFDPLLAMNHHGPVYPLTLVPGWLEKWAKAGVFWDLEGGVGFKVECKGKLWVDRSGIEWEHVEVKGGGKVEGAISLEMRLVSPDLVEGSLAGKTGLEVEVAPEFGEAVEVNVIGKFAGLKGVATLKAAWGLVEFSREFQIMQEREIFHPKWTFGGDGADDQ